MDSSATVKTSGTNISVAQGGQSLMIRNDGGVAFSIQDNLLSTIDVNSGNISPCKLNPCILLPGETACFDLEGDEGSLYILLLGSKKYVIAKV